MSWDTSSAYIIQGSMNYGLQFDGIKPEDFVLGARNELGGKILAPDGQWDSFTPDGEVQNKNGVEPLACVSFTTLNCVEILERKEYGASSNWSDRFLASISGTKEKKGNSPQTVAETLRKRGCVPENDYPFDVNTYEDFYKTVPQRLYTLALAFQAEYVLGHEYVPSNYDSLMEALKYSPLGFSVYAWVKDSDGLYYRPQGMSDGHFTVCYGYERNKYWKIFDSYADDGTVFKKVKWNSLPMQAKRYTLHRQVVIKSWFDKFIAQLRAILGL